MMLGGWGEVMATVSSVSTVDICDPECDLVVLLGEFKRWRCVFMPIRNNFTVVDVGYWLHWRVNDMTSEAKYGNTISFESRVRAFGLVEVWVCVGLVRRVLEEGIGVGGCKYNVVDGGKGVGGVG
jgi:hypothetical protein